MIKISTNWQSSHPGAALGVLTMRKIHSQEISTSLNEKRGILENQLRERYQGMKRTDFLQVPEIAAYSTYYRRFKKTYHLLLQLESVSQKDKSIPTVVPLVQAMFMAELNSLLLTAGHDLDQIHGSIELDSASGEEIYTLLRGEKVTCKSGDMVTADSEDVFCSVIYGQDQRTRITQSTRNVLYVVYVPNGIPAKVIENHLSDLEENVRLITPHAETEFRNIYFAKPADPTSN
jgi:DNA/RNA-binding domain of Phe-tRNA-synthetase-like protein